MEKNNFGFDYHKHPHMLSRDLNLSGFPFNNGYLNTDPVRRNHNSVEDFASRDLPPFPISGLQHLKASEQNNSLNWFHLKPHFHQAVAPISNSPASLFDFGQQRDFTINTQPAQKRFLVFDQSGDKTTLLYSSGALAPVQFGAYRVPTAPVIHNLKESWDANNHLTVENFDDFSRDVTQDEMQEDSEEIDALLYSDYDTDFSEDDETSTGHSPSTMTDNSIPYQVEETGEEVDSFSVPTKKRKLPEGGYDAPSLKTVTCSALESDAESSCGNGKEDSNLFSGSKRSRKEKIHETVSILQSIIPNANRKDAIVVIDEAIRYLKSLKVEARALGLDSI